MVAAKQKDVVDVLTEQHNEINKLFRRVASAKGTNKRESFEKLVRLLTVHESAEEEVLHPAADNTRPRDHVVESRLHEEHEAKQALAELCDLGVDHPDFDEKLNELAEAVADHNAHEEKDEFPRLRETLPQQRLQRMGVAVRAAEQTGPTRPHPGTGESAAAQILLGTPIGAFDRMRDTVRDWRHKQTPRRTSGRK